MNKPEKYKRFNPPASEGTCSRCKETKDSTGFYTHPQRPNGLQYTCKACMRADYVANAAERIERNRQSRWMDTRVRLASDARCRDRRAGRVSDIEAQDIVIPEVCPVTGRPMWHGKDKRQAWTPALVRIDKSKGYVQGNWRVVSWETVKFSGMVPGTAGGPEDPADVELPRSTEAQ